MKKINSEWFIAAAVRAAKTAAQTILGMIGVGAVIPAYDINWGYILGVALTTVILSFCTSIVGLPEVESDGTMYVDNTNPEKTKYRLALDEDLSAIQKMERVAFKVEHNADLAAIDAETKEIEGIVEK